MTQPSGPSASSEFSVACVKDHDEVYPIWKAKGIYQSVLVHLDQHADFQWANHESPLEILKSETLAELDRKLKHTELYSFQDPGRRGLHLGNYLCRVFQEKMVSRWFWIVPTPIWKTSYLRFELWQQLQELYRRKTGPMTPPVEGKNHYSVSFWGVETWIGSIENMPVISQPVVLNIDLDFFSTTGLGRLPPIEKMKWRLPWTWPESIVSTLKSKLTRVDSAAIASSIDGGFTPLRMKFLQNGLKDLLENRRPSESYELLKRVWALKHESKHEEARTLLTSFKALGIEEATRLAWLAEDKLNLGHESEARELYRQAISLDSDFNGIYSTLAFNYEWEGKFKEAMREYGIIKRLIPHASWISMGEARYYLSKREFRKAAAIYQSVIEVEPQHGEALRLLGELYLYYGDFEKARTYLEKSQQVRPEEPQTFVSLAQCLIYEKKYSESRNLLREAMRRGWHKPKVYDVMAESYWREGRWALAWQNYFEAVRLWMIIWKFKIQEVLRQWVET